MRKKIRSHLLLVIFLLTGLTCSFYKSVYATDENKHLMLITSCCAGGVLTGYSNDCIDGEGQCTDRVCSAGETETTGLCQ